MRALVLFALGLAPLAAAQTAPETAIQQASGLVRTDEAVGSASSAEETLAALLPSLVPGTNAVVLVQEGSGNTASVAQLGLDNRFGLVQIGLANAVDAQMVGNANTAVVTQIGDGNDYRLVMEADGVELLPVLQEGIGNRAEQVVQPGLQPAGIEQRGNGLELLIERRAP